MSKKVGVCIIGTGRAGMIHAWNFRKHVPQAELVAVVDPNVERAREAAQELEIGKYYSTYQEAIEDKEVDAVVVVAPTVFHREIVVAAANAKKHVLCEKPMAMDEAECDQMIEAALNNKVILQIAFMRRFDESFNLAKQAIDRGDIGEVVLVKSLTRGPSTPQEWMYDLEKSNGPLAEVNSHDIDTLRWFTGSDMEHVYALAGNYRCKDVQEQYPDFYDNVVLVSKFKNGMQGVIDGAVSVKYGYDARVEILGTEGVIFVGQTHDKTVAVCSIEKGVSRPMTQSWRSLFKDAYLAEGIHFVDCIIHNQEPLVTGYDGKMAVKIVNAGNRSIKEGRIISLD